MEKVIRIGTRESQLAVWQANTVKQLLAGQGFQSELVYIKSEGDIDLKTPLYEIGVQGIFTKALDIALLNDKIDIAVHSMKDVPTVMAKGVVQAAVLPRASHKDLLVPHSSNKSKSFEGWHNSRNNIKATIATSSIRRKAQWLNRYPEDTFENLRGNVNTRLKKLDESNWNGAVFAAAGLERINLRPENAIELDWMLPAPAQGAIIVVCRENDKHSLKACTPFHDENTALCTKLERDFLRALMGGCSTPISALAQIDGGNVTFTGNILSTDGKQRKDIKKTAEISAAANMGREAAAELLANGGHAILKSIQDGK
jgi:hydroxymethylbilane synthase